MNKRTKHPTLDLELSFDLEAHSYVDSNGVKYSGITGLIKNWFEKFDAVATAEKCSKNPKKKEYFGVKVEEIVAKWEENGKKAREFGTDIHEFAEYLLKDKKATRFVWGDPLHRVVQAKTAMANFIDQEFLTDYEIIEPEFMIFSPELRLATMIDVLARHKKTGHILIGDWKTNKKIDKKSFFDRSTGKYKGGLGELECVQDCNYQHYAIQVNLCQEILEREEYFPVGTKFVKKIFHLKEDKRKKKDAFSVESHTIREKRKPIEIMMDKRLAEVELIKMDETKDF